MKIRERALFGAAMAGAFLFAACGNEPIPQRDAEPVIKKTYKAKGGEWQIACYPPLEAVPAEPGDTLGSLVTKANTTLVYSSTIGRSSVPETVYFQAIADINNLADKDVITPGNSYLMPERCQPQ